MYTRTILTTLIAILFNAILFNMASFTAHTESQTALPYAEAGISEREAATHLLERFAFGARPDDIDRVVEMGLSVWLEQQLSGNLPSPMLEGRLSGFRSLSMSARDIVNTYPRNGTVRSQAIRAGILPKDYSKVTQSEIRKKLKAFSQEKGYRPPGQLNNELLSQKLFRGVYSENQLVEVLTDFWFNHFNVTIRDNQASLWVPSYERDAIRPHVLGKFRDLLGATAKHPAMLYYLDNAQSTAPPALPRRRKVRQLAGSTEAGSEMMEMTAPPKRAKRGINEKQVPRHTSTFAVPSKRCSVAMASNSIGCSTPVTMRWLMPSRVVKSIWHGTVHCRMLRCGVPCRKEPRCSLCAM